MKKKIMHDYINSFRWSNIKKAYRGGNDMAVFWIGYSMAIPIFTNMPEENLLHMYVAMIFIGLTMLNATVVSLRLPKLLYLCPMSQEERLTYLRGKMIAKLTVPTVAGILLAAVWTLVKHMPIGYGVAYGVAAVSLTICSSITTWPGSIWHREDTNRGQNRMERVKDARLKGLHVASLLGKISIFQMWILVGLFEEDDIHSLALKILFTTLSVALAGLSLWVLRYAKVVVEISTEYETLYLNNQFEMEARA